jgi:hypothetical protein
MDTKIFNFNNYYHIIRLNLISIYKINQVAHPRHKLGAIKNKRKKEELTGQIEIHQNIQNKSPVRFVVMDFD